MVNSPQADSIVDGILQRRPSVGLAVGVVQDGRLEYFRGHGVSDISSRRPIAEDTVFRIASITKTFTAISVMQLWEQGLVDLDAPANNYLRSYSLTPADPNWRAATVRHLLTHTAGIGEVAHLNGLFAPDFGESVPAGDQLPSPAEFYGGAIRLHAEPGKRFVYNNHGPTTLGQIVEDVTGQTLDRYLRGHIFDPLGMSDSDLRRTERIKLRLATGYEIHSNNVEEVAERDMVTAGAASVYSTPRDMARYLAALLGHGSNDHGSILKPATVERLYAAQYQPDPRIPGMGLGFFRSRVAGEIAVGHQGTHPGFHSQVLLSPRNDIGVLLFTNGTRQADLWLPTEAARLLEQVVGRPTETIRPEVPHRPEVWADISGWYRLDARITDIRLRGFIGAGLEVFVGGGRPMLRFLTPIPALARGFPLIPDDPKDPYAFRIEPAGPDLDPMRVVFGQDPDGKTTRAHFEMMPLTLDKQPETVNPRRWAVAGLGAAGIVIAAQRARKRASRSIG